MVGFPNGHDDVDDATGCTTRHWDSGTTTSWCPDGPITVIGGGGANGTLNPDGSSSRTINGATTPSAPSPTNTGAYTQVLPGGGSMTCTSATTAGGYGRTCFYERPDGGYGVVGATAFRTIGGDGNLHQSGPIDRREYEDTSLGTLNIEEAARYIAAGADFLDAAMRFDIVDLFSHCAFAVNPARCVYSRAIGNDTDDEVTVRPGRAAGRAAREFSEFERTTLSKVKSDFGSIDWTDDGGSDRSAATNGFGRPACLVHDLDIETGGEYFPKCAGNMTRLMAK